MLHGVKKQDLAKSLLLLLDYKFRAETQPTRVSEMDAESYLNRLAEHDRINVLKVLETLSRSISSLRITCLAGGTSTFPDEHFEALTQRCIREGVPELAAFPQRKGEDIDIIGSVDSDVAARVLRRRVRMKVADGSTLRTATWVRLFTKTLKEEGFKVEIIYGYEDGKRWWSGLRTCVGSREDGSAQWTQSPGFSRDILHASESCPSLRISSNQGRSIHLRIRLNALTPDLMKLERQYLCFSMLAYRGVLDSRIFQK